MGFLTHLNDISILYDCSQQFAVFRLILLLFQVSSMLTERRGKEARNTDFPHNTTVFNRCISGKKKQQQYSYMEFVEKDCVSGAVSSRFCCLPELFLCRVSVHGTQFEKAVWGKETRQENSKRFTHHHFVFVLVFTDTWLCVIKIHGRLVHW